MVAHCRLPQVFHVDKVDAKVATAGAPDEGCAPVRPTTTAARARVHTPRTRFTRTPLRRSRRNHHPRARRCPANRRNRAERSVDRYAEGPLVGVVEQETPGSDGCRVDV